ncbi:MAG: hypothetical protein DDT30_01489 [Dehalococcoidia bacterium]|nr:hypothetical protein [Bacillota bacterium]
MRKKMLLMFVLTYLIVLFAASHTIAQDFNFASKAQLLMDTNSRKILYQNNIHHDVARKPLRSRMGRKCGSVVPFFNIFPTI